MIWVHVYVVQPGIRFWYVGHYESETTAREAMERSANYAYGSSWMWVSRDQIGPVDARCGDRVYAFWDARPPEVFFGS